MSLGMGAASGGGTAAGARPQAGVGVLGSGSPSPLQSAGRGAGGAGLSQSHAEEAARAVAEELFGSFGKRREGRGVGGGADAERALACFDEVMSVEIAKNSEGSSQETLSPENLFEQLNGEKHLVEPVLEGQRRIVCSYGRRAGRHRVLRTLGRLCVEAIVSLAERSAATKLFSLRLCLLECSLFDHGASVIHDVLGEQLVDAAGISAESTGVLQPLGSGNLPSLLSKFLSPESLRGRAEDGSGHFVLHLEAEHANDDLGSLTLVSLASLQKMSKRFPQPRGEDFARAYAEHANSLKRVSKLAAEFPAARAACGKSCPSSLSTTLVILDRAEEPPGSMLPSHASTVTKECMTLAKERSEGAGADPAGDANGLSRARHAMPPLSSSKGFNERHCVLPTPPGSERGDEHDELSWDGGSRASSLGPLLAGAAARHAGGNAGHVHSNCGAYFDHDDHTAVFAQYGDRLSASWPGPGPDMGGGQSQSRSAGDGHSLLQALAAAESAGWFDEAAWQASVQQEGRSPEEQIAGLLQVIRRTQETQAKLCDVVRRSLHQATEAPRVHVVELERENWMHRLPSSSPAIRIERPESGFDPSAPSRLPLATTVPMPSLRTGAAAGLLPAPSSAMVAGGQRTTPTMATPLYAIQSPRWTVREVRSHTSDGLGMADGFHFHPDGQLRDPPSPLTRSRSAKGPFVTTSMQLGTMGLQGDVAMSPFVPLRDPTPARSRSVAPGSVATPAATVVKSHGHARAPVPYSSKTALPAAAVPAFPPPVQAGGIPVAMSADHTPTSLTSQRDPLGTEDVLVSSGHGLAALTSAKASDRAPHSARSGLPAGAMLMARPTDMGRGRVVNMRLEQASPFRVRYAGGSVTAGHTPSNAAANAVPSLTGSFSSSVPAGTGPAPAQSMMQPAIAAVAPPGVTAAPQVPPGGGRASAPVALQTIAAHHFQPTRSQLRH
eukprot:TRINITY_DN59074_c0_g1_i1.p1 TRINITY_DN59074_c0_g1~~TRINITY_DN59074_c0_g1_i1.p1  ORF type:complete len:950 (-),score=179.55 TRINITY_DN59074_c0_g1_i1:111-2960(-)